MTNLYNSLKPNHEGKLDLSLPALSIGLKLRTSDPKDGFVPAFAAKMNRKQLRWARRAVAAAKTEGKSQDYAKVVV